MVQPFRFGSCRDCAAPRWLQSIGLQEEASAMAHLVLLWTMVDPSRYLRMARIIVRMETADSQEPLN